MGIDDIVFESARRLEWFIGGINIHGLSPELFSNLPTERIVELYNIDISYFKKNIT
jgi:hypothetical protein